MSRFKKILLLDGYSTRTLACVRSWGRSGVPFAVGGENRWDMSLRSRYSSEKFVYTSPKTSVARFIEDINRRCVEFGADCIFPTSEAAIMACNEHRAELAATAILPDARHIQIMFSKAATLEIAGSVGVKVPRTVHLTPARRGELDKLTLDFPVAVKSDNSEVLGGARTVTAQKTAYISNQTDLLRECNARLDQGNGVLLQEFIDGYGVGVSGLFNEGRPVAILGHQRLRESDPCGGPSALAETIELKPPLLEATTAIMRKIGVTGPAMVEYKVHRSTGCPYFMEINGRFWGTILLAPAAGLDLPLLYWKLINGLPITEQETRYRIGVKGRYLVGDTKNLLLSLRGRPKNWPGHFRTRGLALKDYARSFFDPQTTELILTSDDPMPFFARLVQDFV